MKTTASWWLTSIVDGLKEQQMPVEDWFQKLGLEYRKLKDPEYRFSQDAITQLWLLAEEYSNNPLIGFEIGQNVPFRSFNVLGYAVLSSATLRQGFTRFLRYQKVLGEAANIRVAELDAESNCLVIDFDFQGDELEVCHHTLDMAMACTYTMARSILLDQAELKRIYLTRLAPKSSQIQALTDYYGCTILFGQAQNRLVIPADLIDTPIPHANEEVAKHNEELVKRFLVKQETTENLVGRVKDIISVQLKDGAPTKDFVAAQFNMSSKTFQRRLKDEGFTFLELITEVRQTLAKELLGNSELSIPEIAYMLGFSEVSNFHRAFKRWYNQTPNDFRQRQN